MFFHEEGWKSIEIKMKNAKLMGAEKKSYLKFYKEFPLASNDSRNTYLQCGLSSAITIFNLSKKQIDIRKSLLHDDIVNTLMDAKSTDCILIFSSCKIETSCCTLRNEDFFYWILSIKKDFFHPCSSSCCRHVQCEGSEHINSRYLEAQKQHEPK